LSAALPSADTRRPRLLDSLRRIAPLAWPVFVGQVAVLAFSTVDTVLVARHSALDLAALAVGAAAYVTIFLGFMGAVLAVGPITGQLFGARRLHDAGEQLHQAVWLALALALVGSALLLWPTPFLRLSHATPAVAEKITGYLRALACALPAALLFTAYRGFNTAVSRPKAVMALQLGGLALKLPLSALFVYGLELPAGWTVPSLGTPGCGIATAIVMWCQAGAAWWIIRHDAFYAPFALQHRRLSRPNGKALRALVRLGAPMGLSILIEVTGFTFMAFFIARLGAIPVAGHQIAANIVALLFMMPLALANATSTLVAQRIGADDPHDARRVGWHGVQIAVMIAAAMGSCVFLARDGVVRLYTHDGLVAAAALPLVSWVALFHICDAAQALSSFVLRAWRIATVPLLIYAFSIWGVGLGGGYLVAFDLLGVAPPTLRGASGFWFASTLSLAVAALGLGSFLAWVLKRRHA
jgi:MATE family multidrug resistance protein